MTERLNMLLVGGMQNQQMESEASFSNDQSHELLSSPLTAAAEGGREAEVSEGGEKFTKKKKHDKNEYTAPQICCLW